MFDTRTGGFNPAIPKPKPHPFAGVIKNAPNSKCYMDVSTESPMKDLLEEDLGNDREIFVNYFKEIKDFQVQFEREKLKQELSAYQNLFKKYLAMNSK